MHKFSIDSSLEKNMQKLFKKDRTMYESLMKKIEEIITCKDVTQYKNLKKPMQRFKRVHVRKSFVLIFKYNEKNNSIEFYDFDYHDGIYQN